MAKGNVTVSKIRQGQTIYLVTAIGYKSHIRKVVIKRKPITIDLFGDDCVEVSINSYYETSLKMKVNSFMAGDYNVWPERNTMGYAHRAFYSKSKALKYRNKLRMISVGIHSGFNDMRLPGFRNIKPRLYL